MNRNVLPILLFALGASVIPRARAAQEGSPIAEGLLFKASPLTEERVFTEGIEGPACDGQGNIYAVNFERQQPSEKSRAMAKVRSLSNCHERAPAMESFSIVPAPCSWPIMWNITSCASI